MRLWTKEEEILLLIVAGVLLTAIGMEAIQKSRDTKSSVERTMTVHATN